MRLLGLKLATFQSKLAPLGCKFVALGPKLAPMKSKFAPLGSKLDAKGIPIVPYNYPPRHAQAHFVFKPLQEVEMVTRPLEFCDMLCLYV